MLLVIYILKKGLEVTFLQSQTNTNAYAILVDNNPNIKFCIKSRFCGPYSNASWWWYFITVMYEAWLTYGGRMLLTQLCMLCFLFLSAFPSSFLGPLLFVSCFHFPENSCTCEFPFNFFYWIWDPYDPWKRNGRRSHGGVCVGNPTTSKQWLLIFSWKF